MSPFATLLTRWVETLANESANLDALTRTRLRALAGRSISIVIDPPGETTTLRFEDDSLRLTPDATDAPSVIVRGTPVALATAFLGSGSRGGSVDRWRRSRSRVEFRSIVHDFRPDVLSPLESLVGTRRGAVDRECLRDRLLGPCRARSQSG